METTSDAKNHKSPDMDLSQPTCRILTPDESQKLEVRSAREILLRPKIKISLGTWNVRTMFKTSNAAQVLSEMARYQLDILGISECLWTGAGKQVISGGSVILYSGHTERHENSIAIIVSKEKAKMGSSLTILQCYAPTNEAEYEARDRWYEELQTAVSKVPQHDMLLIIEDINPKVGANNTNYERAMGKQM